MGKPNAVESYFHGLADGARALEVAGPVVPPTPYRLASGASIPDMHPDDVEVVAGVVECYAGLAGELDRDAIAHGLAAWRAARERRRIAEAAHARRHALARGIVPAVRS